MAQNKKTGTADSLAVRECLDARSDVETFDGAGIGAVAKAALSDFVSGKTPAAATREVTRLLGVMCKARTLQLTEENRDGQGHSSAYVYYV